MEGNTHEKMPNLRKYESEILCLQELSPVFRGHSGPEIREAFPKCKRKKSHIMRCEFAAVKGIYDL